MNKTNRFRANERMVEALDLIKKGKSQRYAEEKWRILRRTLRDHTKSQSAKRKLGRRTISTK